MSNDKLVIDLGRFNLTNPQRKAVHHAIHKAVANQLERFLTSPEEEVREEDIVPATLSRGMDAAAISAATANLQVTFLNANTGLTELTAILNGQRQSIAKSGSISFPNVESGDLILLQKTGNGSCLITIDVGAVPMQVSFPPGKFNDQFFIN